MSSKELDSRLEAYRLAYDRAVLVAPPDVRLRFADEWTQVVERGGVKQMIGRSHEQAIRP
jgi:hypothetical protein